MFYKFRNTLLGRLPSVLSCYEDRALTGQLGYNCKTVVSHSSFSYFYICVFGFLKVERTCLYSFDFPHYEVKKQVFSRYYGVID